MRFVTTALLCLSPWVSCLSAQYKNPVYPADFADPSVIRVGREYWATATSSEWGPQFPILKSRDLVNWSQVGVVFERPPEWAVGNFWAPEIQEWRGKYYVYYVARQRGGPLSVAVATAAHPAGPYQDHGVIVAQDVGSIDPVAVDDENGERYLIWKDDGNSRRQPTYLWAAKLNQDGTQIVGEHKQLFRNELPWEGGVIEGPFLVRHNDWFYLFYSGNACCGGGCAYALGVARSRNLLGPWEKNLANPILGGNEHWRCPGHGTIVQDPQNRYWLLYHAYAADGFVSTGRQALLDQVTWNEQGWPTINAGKGPSMQAVAPVNAPQKDQSTFADNFNGSEVSPRWNWPLAQNGPAAELRKGRLVLSVPPEKNSAILARSLSSGDFRAQGLVDRKTLTPGTAAGLAVIGDPQNAAGISIQDQKVLVWRARQGKREVLAEAVPPNSDRVYLLADGRNGKDFTFGFSSNGKSWTRVGPVVPGGDMPPWDRALRTGFILEGPAGATAAFDNFSMKAAHPKTD